MALTEEQRKSIYMVVDEVLIPSMAKAYNQALDDVLRMLDEFQILSKNLVTDPLRKEIYTEVAKAFADKIATYKMPESATKPPATKSNDTVKFVECDMCDGCGWYEGGPTIKTTCEHCKGTGLIAKPV